MTRWPTPYLRAKRHMTRCEIQAHTMKCNQYKIQFSWWYPVERDSSWSGIARRLWSFCATRVLHTRWHHCEWGVIIPGFTKSLKTSDSYADRSQDTVEQITVVLRLKLRKLKLLRRLNATQFTTHSGLHGSQPHGAEFVIQPPTNENQTTPP